MKTFTITIQLEEKTVEEKQQFLSMLIKEINEEGLTQRALDLASCFEVFKEPVIVNAKLD